VFGGGLAGADGVKKLTERRVVRLHEHDDHVAHRAGLAAGQRLPERGQGEDTGFGLGEHAHAGQRAQQTVQRRRMHAGPFGEDLRRHRARYKLIATPSTAAAYKACEIRNPPSSNTICAAAEVRRPA
jgi:hypothetical protein